MVDIIIIGAGIAGMTSALYAARSGKSVLLIDNNNFGGQIINSNEVDNYPGIKSIDGFTLMKNLYDQVMSYDVKKIDEEVIGLKDNNTVITTNGEYVGKTIIIASGLVNRTLPVLDNITGISYCAMCDGNFYRNKDVLVVGGGNTAFEDVIYLSNIVNKVYLINRRNEFRADKVLVDKLLNTSNIEVITPANISEVKGNVGAFEVLLDNGATLNVSGIFLAIGKIPNTSMFKDIIDLDEVGYIVSDDCRTNVENIFVAGDVRTKNVRQLITAASDGAIAATLAEDYLNKN